MILASTSLAFKHFHLHKLKAMVAALTGAHLSPAVRGGRQANNGSNASRDMSKECMGRRPRTPFGKPNKHSKWAVTFTDDVTLA